MSAGRQRRGRPARRWRLAGVLAAILLIAAAGAVMVALSRHQAAGTGQAANPDSDGSRRLAAAATARDQAVSWVAGQVSRAVIVACDQVACSALAERGFPAASLSVIGPTAPDPLAGGVLIATADLRSQFGRMLAAVYAPVVLASFGSGAAHVDIRVIAPDGAAAYHAALGADLLARKAAGAALLRNHGIRTSAEAKHQLLAGLVDARLLSAIAFLVHQRPVDIVEFGGFAPGAAAGVPLRFADLAESDARSHLRGASYLRSLLAVLRSGTPLYRPASAATVRLATGQPVLRIQFPAPSPLGLLGSGAR